MKAERFTTAKISRQVFDTIHERTKRRESYDKTLRRVLIGEVPGPRKTQKGAIVVLKLSRGVRDFIRQNARPQESVDDTLRRLLTSEMLRSI